MPKWAANGGIYHSNAAPNLKNIYTAPMITVKPSVKGNGFIALSAKGHQVCRLLKSPTEINSILIGHGYIKTGEEADKQFYSKII